MMIAPLLLAAPLFSAVQDALPRKEQEVIVSTYLALGLSLPAQIEEGRRLLKELEGVPFPAKRDLKRWHKLFAESVEQRLDAHPVGRKAGEHRDELDGRSGRYFLGGNLKRPKGLFVGLHGGGAGSGDAGTSAGSWGELAKERGWLGLFPEVLEKTERGWTDSGTEEWVLDLTARVAASFGVDPDKVIIGGHSMGGYGGWVLGAHHADRFAAALASAGAPTPQYQGGRIVSIQKGVVPNLSVLPLFVFQSTDDPKVGPDANQAAVREVEKAKARYGGYEHFEYWEVNDRQHGFPQGGAGVLLDKVLGFEREAVPEQVVWQPSLTWKRQFYWLAWDEPKLGAVVVARRDVKANAIEVELRRTDGEGLSVLLDERVLDMSKPVTVRVNGKRVFEGMVTPSFTTLVETAAHGDPGRVFVARVPVK